MQKSFHQLLDATVAPLEHVGRACSVSGCYAIWQKLCVSMQLRISTCIAGVDPPLPGLFDWYDCSFT